MVTRRGYLSSTGGFADGFTSGFGLMNQAYTDKRKLNQADEEMQYERERNQAADAESLRRFNASESAAERRFGLQQAAADRQATAQEKANEISSGIAATRAETELLRQQAATRELEAADAEQAKRQAKFRAFQSRRQAEQARIFQLELENMRLNGASEIDILEAQYAEELRLAKRNRNLQIIAEMNYQNQRLRIQQEADRKTREAAEEAARLEAERARQRQEFAFNSMEFDLSLYNFFG